tara:strand:+ start:3871 stop:4140 length:270 start_codon:yes stop_codon:yes gene_type:complete
LALPTNTQSRRDAQLDGARDRAFERHLVTTGDFGNLATMLVSDAARKVIAPTVKVRCPHVRLPKVHLHEPGTQNRRPIAAPRDLDPNAG